MGRGFVIAPTIICAIAILLPATPHNHSSNVATLAIHEPIHITTDAEFNSTNGVTGGTGTASDPYIIEGWEFSSSGGTAIWIQNTHSHFVISNLSIQDNRIELAYCSNGRILDSSIMMTTSDTISIWSCSNIEVDGCTLSLDEYAGAGVRISGSTNITVSDCHISDSYWGIMVYEQSRFVNITGNNITRCTYNGGILALDSHYVDISNNTLTSAGIGVNGSYQTLSMDDNNTVDGRPVYFFKDEDGITLDGVPIGQLIAVNCQGFHASNLSFTNVFDGIYVAISDDLRIENCTFSSVGNVGINLDYCADVTLFRNDLRDFDVYGTCMDYCSDIVVTCNTFARSDSSHHGQGVLLYHSSSAVMYANRMVDILVGIMAWDCTEVDIRHNAMVNIFWSGVQLADSDNVRITENLIALCTQTSSYSDSALEIYRSSQVTVLNNSFVENVAQVTVSDSDSIIWNGSYPMGGNYWSDYTGIDLMSGPNQTLSGSDGFGDSPYAIDASNNDHYPLMASGIENLPPMAFFTSSPVSGNTSTVFTVDSSGSWDFENSSGGLSFRWDWEGDGVWDTDWSANDTWNHTYSNGGNFTMRLEVRDGEGATDVYSVLTRVAEPQHEDVPGQHGIDIVAVAAIAGVIAAVVLVALLLLLRKKNPPSAMAP